MVAWLAGMLCLLPRALEKDEQWNGPTLRQRVVAGLEHAVWWGERSGRLPAVTEMAAGMTAQLNELWPELPPLAPYRSLR